MSLVRTTAQSCPHDGAPADLVQTLPEGTRIADYTITRLLGEGGMGSVYEARHEVLNRRAAMKFLRPELTEKRDVVIRFLQEAKAVNVINHDNIIDIYDYGEGEDGLVYFVMEYLEGEPFTDLLERHGRLPIDLTIHIFSQLMRALAAAHAKNIIHRDLKPDNVYLAKRESDPHFVKLLDFGIARVRSEGAAEGLTLDGSLMGTPQFMSPEQAMGKTIDARSDIFSIGVMLYRALVGERPFDGETLPVLLTAVVTREITPPRQAAPDAGIPESLERMILKATRKDPDRRYASVQEMIVDLARVKAEAGIQDQARTLSESAFGRDGAATPAAMQAGRAVTASGAAGGLTEAHPSTTVDTVAPGARKSWLPIAAIAGIAVIGIAVAGAVVASGGSGGSGDSSGPERPAASRANGTEPAAVQGPAIAALVAENKLAEAQAIARSDLEASLASADGDEARAAVKALTLAATPKLATLLYKALKGSPQARIDAARALRDLDLPAAAPTVREAMADSSPKIQLQLAGCLAVLGDKDAVAILERALGGDPGEQLTAAEALAQLDSGDRDAINKILADAMKAPPGRDRWRRAAQGLLALGDESAREALKAELARPEAGRAVAAAAVLADNADPSGVTYLEQVLDDEEFAERGEAALALARTGNAGALRWVAVALASEDPDDRVLAMAVAARLADDGGKSHAAAIAELTDADDPTVRLTARAALLAF